MDLCDAAAEWIVTGGVRPQTGKTRPLTHDSISKAQE